MQKIIITFILLFLIVIGAISQQTMQLTFTAIDSTYYTQLDSIKIINRSKDCDTMLYWNDTVLVLDVNVGIPELEINKEFKAKAYPNPIMDEAILNVMIPEAGQTDMTITNIQGRLIQAESYDLTAGTHDFRFSPGSDAMYFISFSWEGQTRHLKLINASPEKGRESILSYVGGSDQIVEKKSSKASDAFEFILGDQLLYVGYIDTLESGITDIPLESKTYTFQFAYNIPCIGTPTVEYEGQVYNTVQIFSQCWLAENLNYETGNSWCYDNDSSNCATYGRLYDWYTAMGICPLGWHLPNDDEWKILEGNADTQYGVGDPKWDDIGYRGYNAGKRLKSTYGWYNNDNGTDNFGFAALPGGTRNYFGSFYDIEKYSLFWSSSVHNVYVWSRRLFYDLDAASHRSNLKEYGFSVRCVKD